MPVHVGKKDSKGWPIKEKSGKVVGHSDTKAKAQASCNARNAARHGWKPNKRR